MGSSNTTRKRTCKSPVVLVLLMTSALALTAGTLLSCPSPRSGGANPATQQPVNQAPALLNDAHSVESIRVALKSPIPPKIQQQAQQFDDQVMRSGRVLNQPVEIVTDQRYDRATQIVSTLLRAVHADPSKWVVRVLDTDPKIENAFVVGGRYIYIYTGILDDAQSDDELAFILGHEMSHSFLKHNMRKNEDFTNLLASIAEVTAAFLKNSERREQVGLIGGAMKASYSREDEQEADALGAYIANRASYDPTRGIAFFNRMIRLENSSNAQAQSQFASARQNVEQQIANCQRLQAQWNASPQVRSPQNAQIVNSTCQTAQANAQQYDTAVNRFSSEQRKSVLLATHPVDRDRIAALAATVDYLKGRRSLDSLSGIGQGYRVFVAMNLKSTN